MSGQSTNGRVAMGTDRFETMLPTGAGVVHLVLVFGLMGLLDYPFWPITDVTAAFEIFHRVVGVFLLAFVPVWLLTHVRLVVPAALVQLGLMVTIIAEFTTSGPTFASLDGHVLVVGSTVFGVYTTGWYVWLLTAAVAGSCEYVFRTRVDSLIGPPEFHDVKLPLDRRRSLVVGVLLGMAHATTFVTLGIEREGVMLEGVLFGWIFVGGILLGLVPMYLLVRHWLVGSAIGFMIIVFVTGVEILTTTVGTPATSYQLFWPAYIVVFLIIGVSEHTVRFVIRKAALSRGRNSI